MLDPGVLRLVTHAYKWEGTPRASEAKALKAELLDAHRKVFHLLDSNEMITSASIGKLRHAGNRSHTRITTHE